jgi:hypothetical protein
MSDPFLKDSFRTNPKVIRKTIQECNRNWKKELKAGDFLFIDSSHVIRPQGDVLIEFLEIIRKLC